MHNFCVIWFSTVSFCLVVCVSAITAVNKVDATREVEQAKASVTAVHARAQSELNKVNDLLQRVESSKRDATEASSQAEKTATGNNEAEEIAQQIKSLSDAVDTLYSDAQGKLSTAVSTLTPFVEEAQRLVNAPEIEIKAKDSAPDDFTETNTKATTLKGQVDNLNQSITAALTPVSEVGVKADEMESKAKKAQLKHSHVNAIVAVATINTMLGKADNTIEQIEGKKNAVSVIVEEMRTLKTNHPTVSDDNINALLQNADNALTAATCAGDNAKRAKTAIETQKGLANEALTKIKAENQEVSVAQNEASTAEECVRAAERIVPQLNDALETANNSLTSANNLNQQLQTALSTATSATRAEQSVTQSQVKELQRSVSDDVNRINTIMEETDGNLQETENHKQTVHEIVQEMKTLSTTEFIEANQNIKMLYSKADDALADATVAVKNAAKAKRDMTEQKQKADAALSSVETATDVNTAQKEVVITNACVSQANQFAGILKSALQTAKDSVTSATDLKKKLEKALSTTTTAPSTVENTEKEKTNPPVGQGTEPDPKDTTIQPMSKELPSQSNNSAEEMKDKLINSAQNVPTTALTGGKAPAPGAKNESAMTVSVPLLVALIAAALLQ